MSSRKHLVGAALLALPVLCMAWWFVHDRLGLSWGAPSPSPSVVGVAVAPAASGSALPAMAPDRAPLPAHEVAQAVQAHPAAMDARYRQQRLPLTGVVDAAEAGEEGVVMLSLSLPGQNQGLRMVMADGHQAVALALMPGQTVSVDCLDQGLVMGELVLADCRLVTGSAEVAQAQVPIGR
jgi:hypothetical protein